MSVEIVARNREIYLKHRQGYSYRDLADEYGISHSRVRQIYERERHEAFTKTIDIPEIVESCNELGALRSMNSRIQAIFRIKGLNKHDNWRKLSREEIISIPALGERAADIIIHAQCL